MSYFLRPSREDNLLPVPTGMRMPSVREWSCDLCFQVCYIWNAAKTLIWTVTFFWYYVLEWNRIVWSLSVPLIYFAVKILGSEDCAQTFLVVVPILELKASYCMRLPFLKKRTVAVFIDISLRIWWKKLKYFSKIDI